MYFSDSRWMRLRKMTSGEDAKVVEYENGRAGRWRRKRRMSWTRRAGDGGDGGEWWGRWWWWWRWGGGGATSLRGVLKKTKAAARRRIQCADYRGHGYAQPTNKRDLLSTCMETFWGFYSFFLKFCFCWGLTGEYKILPASSLQFSAGQSSEGWHPAFPFSDWNMSRSLLKVLMVEVKLTEKINEWLCVFSGWSQLQRQPRRCNFTHCFGSSCEECHELQSKYWCGGASSRDFSATD